MSSSETEQQTEKKVSEIIVTVTELPDGSLNVSTAGTCETPAVALFMAAKLAEQQKKLLDYALTAISTVRTETAE